MEKQPHIQLSADPNCNKAIIVGDPARVHIVGELMENPMSLTTNREFTSLIGRYHGVRVLVISTGIGAPSTCIAIEELANIGIKEIIRVGSCGAMQKGIELGELIIAEGAVRDDGLTKCYVPLNYPAVVDSDLLAKAKALSPQSRFGIIRSHDGFYMDNNAEIEAYWSKFGIIGADMESGVLMVVGRLRGLKTLSILNNIVKYQEDLAEGVNSLVSGEDKIKSGEIASIELALKIFATEEK